MIQLLICLKLCFYLTVCCNYLLSSVISETTNY